MCIRTQPFSTYHGKIRSDHVLFIPTWMPKRVQDLDLRNGDCELLRYGAYVHALGCYLMVNVQCGSSLRDPQHGGLNESFHTGRTRHFFLQVCCGVRAAHGQVILRACDLVNCRLTQILAMSPDLMEVLRKQMSMFSINRFNQETHDKTKLK